MPAIIQPSFARGELSPQLYARVDLASYTIGLRTAKNFLVRPYGGVDNRPGTKYIGAGRTEATAIRLIPFEVSTTATYFVELGHQYARFYSNGGLVLPTGSVIIDISNTSPAVVSQTAHGYATGDRIYIENTDPTQMPEVHQQVFRVGTTTANTWNLLTEAGVAVNSLAYGTMSSGGLAYKLPDIVTPWGSAEIFDVRFTQSADVMTLTHPSYPPQTLSRTSAAVFALAEFETKEGPFRDLNTDEAVRVAASARVGVVTITANTGIFTANHVGGLFYIENRNFSAIKPWVPGERDTSGLTVGSLRRSDGKTYICTQIPTTGSPDWTETGGVRPTHERDRAWDGPGDERTNSTQTYRVGVEWEYQDSGFGIVQITAFTSSTQVTGVVVKNLPAGVVGGVGSPSTTWTFAGTNSVGPYAIAGAVSSSAVDYTVTIDGVPEANGQTPAGGGAAGGGGCVSVDAILPGGIRAGDVCVGDVLQVFDVDGWEAGEGAVSYSVTKPAERFRIETARGVTLECSDSAPIPVLRGGTVVPADLLGHIVPVLIDDLPRWDTVVSVEPLGVGMVQHITCENTFFWAGTDAGYIAHHNAKPIYDAE